MTFNNREETRSGCICYAPFAYSARMHMGSNGLRNTYIDHELRLRGLNVWHDMAQDEINETAMMQGVEDS